MLSGELYISTGELRKRLKKEDVMLKSKWLQRVAVVSLSITLAVGSTDFTVLATGKSEGGGSNRKLSK